MTQLDDLYRQYDGPIPPAELAAAKYGPGSYEIFQCRLAEQENWSAARRMLRAAKGWREAGAFIQAGRCIECARDHRTNALFWRRQTLLARELADEWRRRFCQDPLRPRRSEVLTPRRERWPTS